ncbi:GntR family transcriptional regulator [Paenalcaligenes sp. Me131]|uniref:GntR family transcriptional regulator n=1 Tax=Paenalcaligenes sp. Me131 TaxID=3392636 RepID=UPI003D2AC432
MQQNTEHKTAAVPLYEAIATALRTAIAQRVLKAGDLINESMVAQAFNVSRTPVKAALKALVDQNVLYKHSGRGVIVGPLIAKQKVTRLSSFELAALEPFGDALRSPDSWIQVYNDVEREVCNHAIFGPVRIVETELAKSFDVSRTVAHEVLMRLEGVGLVEKDPAGRWSIVPMTPERVRQLYEIRRYLEPPALRKSVEHIPQEVLNLMWERLETISKRYPNVSEAELDDLEKDLHFRCLSYCQNDELIKLLGHTQALLINNKHMLGGYLKLPSMDPFLEEHRLIMQALMQRQPDAVAQALDDHLSRSITKTLERLQVVASEPAKNLPSYMTAIRDNT